MKTMYSNACLLGIALLMSAASASAENTKVTAPTSAGRAVSAQFVAAEMMAFGSVHILGSGLRGVGGIGSAVSLSNAAISPISTRMFEPLQPGDNDGDHHDGDYNNDRDRNHDHDFDRDGKNDRDFDHDRNNVQPHDKAPTPAPEPVTALLFGAALLIGGGILRRRKRGAHT